MELEEDEHLSSLRRPSGLDGDHGFFGGSKGELPFVEQPSRTPFVRNINRSVEDFVWAKDSIWGMSSLFFDANVFLNF